VIAFSLSSRQLSIIRRESAAMNRRRRCSARPPAQPQRPDDSRFSTTVRPAAMSR